MSNYLFGTCPYNKNHRIMLFRMPGHIVKCMKNYRGPPLHICKYNATHRVLDMEEHLKECEDYMKFTETNSYIADSYCIVNTIHGTSVLTDEDTV
ncbi:gametocyte-specific factor 1 [Drosophila pseudoobscura]|uniref:Gametocyte-specific factor 1 n=1 Tax=Drosophila pseudoobscura pseudoobscura TaxID=46245 RepID=A0A6I8UI97_DROPS|nr:gametocyte-specific factor 1 [Drosophila pseudoobscura]